MNQTNQLSYQFFDDIRCIFNSIDVMLESPQVVDVDWQHRVKVYEVHLVCVKMKKSVFQFKSTKICTP